MSAKPSFYLELPSPCWKTTGGLIFPDGGIAHVELRCSLRGGHSTIVSSRTLGDVSSKNAQDLEGPGLQPGWAHGIWVTLWVYLAGGLVSDIY